ncbi:AAA family ATPase [Nocardia asteroides]|uniref:AAA family ATPase n=1 Tax=Nocardia asteroides TaxID=1824 RepID=UPI0037C8EB0D
MTPNGRPAGVLIGLRGNSGSGKSTVARAVQQRFPRASCLVVSQDVVRRIMLREVDTPAATNIDLIEHIAGFGLARGLIVIVEGILHADRYAEMLERLSASAVSALFYSFDLSFEETIRRHAGRPQAREFSPTEMAQWYHGWQPLSFVDEVRLDAGWELETIVDQVCHDIGDAIDLAQRRAFCDVSPVDFSPSRRRTPDA